MSWQQNRLRTRPHLTLIFIFITVCLDMLALGMIAPVLPPLIEKLLRGDTQRAAVIFGVFGTVWAGMQFVFSPVLGSLSDRVGRRPVILLSNLGLGLDYLIMAIAPSVAWLFVGRVLSGITSASIPTAMAYIADTTPAEERAGRFGALSAAFGLGFIVGPAFGGLLGNINPRLPFWVAGGLSLLNALYGLLVLPESLPPDRRSRFSWHSANPLTALRLLWTHPAVTRLAASLFSGYLAYQVLPSVYVLYTAYRYRWSERTVGLSLALVGLCSAAVGAGLVRPVVARVGERAAMIAGLLFGALGFALLGWAPNGTAFVAVIPVVSLWGLAGPTVQSIMTRFVSSSEQGQLQGAMNSLGGIAGLVGPLLFTWIFARVIDVHANAGHAGVNMPGACFFVAAFIVLGAALLGYSATREAHAA